MSEPELTLFSVRQIRLSKEKLPLAEACERLANYLRQEASGRRFAETPLLRLGVAIQPVQPLAILKKTTSPKKFYWADRNGFQKWAAFGSTIEFIDKIGDANKENGINEFIGQSQCTLFGLKRFDDINNELDTTFGKVPKSYLVWPTLEISSENGAEQIYLNVNFKDPANIREALVWLEDISKDLETLSQSPEKNLLDSHAYVVNQDKWNKQFASITGLLNENIVDKVVLANAQDFCFTKSVNSLRLFSQLHDSAQSTYRYYFQLNEEQAFFGASPEQLFSRKGQRIESEAQAGTRRRGDDENEDKVLSEDLLNSQKEYVEHDFVLQDVWSRLSKHCKDYGWIDKRKVVKLNHVQHLRSRFGGILKEGVSDTQLLRSLHPTSAVCGMPADKAQNAIRTLEPFDRGYYCGPVGMMSASKTEFAVALRSAMVSNNMIRSFAGAGIVRGSHPKEEWNEIESKMRPFYELLAGEV